MSGRIGLDQRITIAIVGGFLALALLTAGVVTNRLLLEDARFAAASAAPTSQPTVADPGVTQPTVTISGVGDIIMGSSTIGLPPNNGAGFFDDVRSDLAADVVTGNFEGTLTDDTGHVKCPTPLETASTPDPSATPSPAEPTCYAYRLPPSYAQSLADGGFTALNLANNHTNDYGSAGLKNTQQSLRDVGIADTGLPDQIAIREVRGVKVAVVGFGPYGWMQKVTDIPKARKLVAKAASEADVVVVHMQAGGEGDEYQHVAPGTEEYLGENRGDVTAFARAVVDSGADLVVGHGPHVLRGMEWYKGRLIAYSMGNFAGYRTVSRSGPTGIGGIVKVTLNADGTFTQGSVVATQLVAPGYPAVDPNRRALGTINTLSQQDFGANGVALGSDGAIAPAPAG